MDATKGGVMKYARALFALSVLLGAAPGGAEEQGATVDPVSNAGHEVIVTDKDGEGSVSLGPDDTLVVRLRANPSTGFSWYTVLAPDSLIELIGHVYTPNVPVTPGSEGVEEFRFRPTSAAAGRSFREHEWFRMLSLRPFEPGVRGATLWEIEVVE
jgi:predicted secreted protein